MNWAGSQVILGTDSTVKSLYNREEITFYLAKDCWLEKSISFTTIGIGDKKRISGFRRDNQDLPT